MHSNQRRHRRTEIARAIASIIAASCTAQLMAQEQPSDSQPSLELTEVVVTGSRIKRTGLDTVQPATVVGADVLEDRGVTSVAEALQEVPAFGLPGSSPVGGQSGVQVGQSFVNFFGLGSQRTLTLVDGRRFVAANSPSVAAGTPGLQVDLNTIPAALIDRVETIAVGGAPIYGADAIAGTVNVILKRDFEGFSGTAQTGFTEAGGAQRQRIQGLYGFNFNEGRGNLAVNLEYNRQNGLKASDRKSTAAMQMFQSPAADDPRAERYRRVLIDDGRVVLTNFNGLPLIAPDVNFPGNFANQIKDASGRPLQFAADGTLVPFDPGTPTGSVVWFSGGDGLFLAEAQALLAESERKLANLFFNYDLTDSVRLNVEGWYSNNRATSLASQPSYNEALSASADETPSHVIEGPMALRLDNPFLTDQARAIIRNNLADADGDGNPDPTIDFDGDGVPDTVGFWMSKGHQDLFRGSTTEAEQTLKRGVIGLEGEIFLGDREYSWDTYYSYGRTNSESRNPGMLIREFNLAIDTVRDPVTGQIRCRSLEPGCAPLNVFGRGAPSPEATAYVMRMTRAETQIEQHVASANITGGLLTLPGGDLRFAAGVEYRRESSQFEPDALLASGLLRGAALTGLKGSFETKEIYTEAMVPIVGASQHIPGVHTLELEGAIRYVDHSIAGTDATWTVGLQFAPVEDVRLRGNVTESIRAPAITEMFLPSAQIPSFAEDPCDDRFIDQGTNAQRRAANCATAGVPAGFQSIIVNSTQLVTVEGNKDLKNEKAQSWTVGAVLQPRFAPGLVFTVDWVNIELQDAIEQLDATVILQSCYDSADFPSAAVCQRFGRDADSQIVGMRTGYMNAGTLDFSGLTSELSYYFDAGRIGNFTVGLNYFYLDQLDISVTGTDFDPQAGERHYSRNRATANVTYRKNAFRGFLQAQYIGDAVFDRTDKFDQTPPERDTRDLRGVDAFWVFNASAGYDLSDRINVQVNIDNLLDEEPPYGSLVGTVGASAGSEASTYFSGIMGRTYALTVRANF